MSPSREYVSTSPQETERVGEQLGRRFRGGEVVLLFGPLGAGKTQFVRGLARGLGVDATQVRSPSYTLVMEHPGRTTLYHVDLYRVGVADLPDLGIEELYGGGTVVAVEWAERLEEAGWDLGSGIVVEIDYHPDRDGSRLIAVDEP